MSSVLPFRSKQAIPDGITGAFFWAMPVPAKRRRIRELAVNNFSFETISTICRMPLSAVMSILGLPS